MATTRKILNQEQVNALLGKYITEQTAAAKKAEDAYNREADVARDKEQQTLNADAAKAKTTAAKALDTQLVKELVGKRRLAEQLATWGLSRSGAAATGNQAAARQRQVALKDIAATRDAALAAIKQKSEALVKQTEAKKQKNTASSQKTLANRIAEKRLSLSKLLY